MKRATVGMLQGVITMKTLIGILLASCLLTACNTMAGMGQDVSSAGHAVTNAADDVKSKM